MRTRTFKLALNEEICVTIDKEEDINDVLDDAVQEFNSNFIDSDLSSCHFEIEEV